MCNELEIARNGWVKAYHKKYKSVSSNCILARNRLLSATETKDTHMMGLKTDSLACYTIHTVVPFHHVDVL